MNNALYIQSSMHWAAVVLYAVASFINAIGFIFGKQAAERRSYLVAAAGLLVHGSALAYRWISTGHGPYMVRFEVLSSNAWVIVAMFLLFVRLFPRIRFTAILIFPAAFFLITLGLFYSDEYRKLPPTLNSIWLVLHVAFIKISLATLLIALAFSIFFILKNRGASRRLDRLPEPEILDTYAYRFAGFGFLFWTNATLSGSLWAYQSWGRFWGWDPIETWSLVTWIFFGVYLHLRRFFGWKGEKAAWLFVGCFLLAIISLFFVPLLQSSIHSEYFTQ